MALIETAIPPEALLGSPGDSLAHLTLQVPGQEELEVCSIAAPLALSRRQETYLRKPT
jgi:hypothetical protein